MIKKLIFKFIILLTITIYLFTNVKVKANTKANIYFVFDQQTYKTNEIVSLTINLDQFVNLCEVKLQIKLNYEYLEPIVENDKYFNFNTSSICKNDIINDYTIDNILRLRIIKDDLIDEGYNSTYKNNLCLIKFKTKKPIENIYSLFSCDKYIDYGTSVYLFDNNDKIIEYEAKYLEKIKITWDKPSYEVEVFSNLPNIKDDIKVENRAVDEYEYLIENNVDTSIIGLKTVHIAIYDKLTADYIVMSKAINVKDITPPYIICENEYKINDTEIDTFDFKKIIQISDNYDQVLIPIVKYYDVNLNEILEYEEYKKYIKNNQLSYIKYIVTDSSNNKVETELIEIEILDTKPPTINKIAKIEVLDTEIDNFNIDECININDEYDNNPKIVYSFLDEEIKNKLNQGIKIEFTYFGIDESGNKTEEINCIIIPIDTTSPTIFVEDIRINDIDFKNINYNDYITIKDNFIDKVNVQKEYYIKEENVAEDVFNEKIQKGEVGFIKYIVYDNALNYSSEAIQNISLIDTTPPSIIVNNINNNEKYINIEKIEYEIKDNFEKCNVSIYLDDLPYNNEKIEIGKHRLFIEATDLSGNSKTLYLEFEIIEDNLIGCGNDLTCYINNYLEIVIIVGVLLLLVSGMIVAHLIIKNKKEETM